MRALVTGASRGLGREIALALVREHYETLVISRTRPAVTRPLFVWEQWDLQDETQVRGLCSWLSTDHNVEVLVNNASTTHPLNALQMVKVLDVLSTFYLNFFVPMELMQAILPVMLAKGRGVIVNISSYCGRRGIPQLAGYCASKAALRIMTECVAKEIEGTGVKVFSVSPGGMKTQMRTDLFGEGDAAKQQSPAFVATTIVDAIQGRLHVDNGGDLVIRHGQVTVREMGSQA